MGDELHRYNVWFFKLSTTRRPPRNPGGFKSGVLGDAKPTLSDDIFRVEQGDFLPLFGLPKSRENVTLLPLLPTTPPAPVERYFSPGE